MNWQACRCVDCISMPVSADGFHRDPKTGIRPIHEWGDWCARGAVSNARFAGGTEQVIPGTNRDKTRAIYRAKR